MSTVSSTGTTTSTDENYYVTSSSENEDTKANDELDENDFIQLLVTELTNQDPLDPVDTASLMTQFTQMETVQTQLEMSETLEELNETMTENFSSISDSLTSITDSLSGLNDALDSILNNQDSASLQEKLQAASALVGYYVYGTDADGNSVEGMVCSATVSDGDAYVYLSSGDTISYDNITEVTAVVYDSGDSTDDTTADASDDSSDDTTDAAA